MRRGAKLDRTRPSILRWPAPCLRIIIIVALVAVVVALFTALVFLYRDKGKGERMVAALAVRVVLSALLIAFLVIGYRMGWIAPMGAR
jgi:predicted membrane-bound dolichyl-phosphate-mannose-protein mannosyltransferase